MRIIRHVRTTPQQAKGAVVAIGNFDGVHRGHQGIIGKTLQLAAEAGRPAAVMTFEPHPRTRFQPDGAPFRLTPFRVKARLIRALGVDVLFALPFNRALSSLEPDAFIDRVLVDGLACSHVVVGDNFRFGRKRAGDIAALQQGGRRRGFGVTPLSRMKSLGDEPYSSTGVRTYLNAGAPAKAAMLLGRYYEIDGRIRHDGTDAMLRPGAINLPAEGVYAVRLALNGSDAWDGAVAEIRHVSGAPHPRCAVAFLPTDGAAPPAGTPVRLALIERLGPLTAAATEGTLQSRTAAYRAAADAVLTSEDWSSDWPASPILAPPH
jgi:riboflavin kinase/FMN adenylyltransferase